MEKKVWSKPRLVVLVRGKPEEAILQGCKTNVGPGSPTITVEACWEDVAVLCDINCADIGST